MTTATIEDLIQQRCQEVRDRFQQHGWRTKKVARYAHVYMIWKPNHVEYCYFVAWVSRRDGIFILLPEVDSESYSEANRILRGHNAS